MAVGSPAPEDHVPTHAGHGEARDRSLEGVLDQLADLLAHLRHLSTHDPLTSLPNRGLFSEWLDRAAADGHASVIFIDLDRFKLVNDGLGLGVGDEVLRGVASRLAGAVVAPNLVACLGGDEFTVLLPAVNDPLDPVREAQRLLAIVDRPFHVRGRRVTIQAGAGVAVTDGPMDDPTWLLRMADVALHHAKEGGRGRVEVYDRQLLAASMRRLEIEALLLDALASGRVSADFQPEVRLSTQQVVGVEALARCRAGDGSFVPPDQFIPVAEEAGLIGRVFEVVLADALALAVRTESAICPPIVWVNVSAPQLRSDLVDQIDAAVGAWHVDPSRLGFEVTEQAVLVDPADAAGILARLADRGHRLALDDFGTGFSSLSHLQELPIDMVKLDRQFVEAADRDQRSRAIAAAIVDLARATGLWCVAEGVEHQRDLDVMTTLGCDIVQGYYFSRPCRADLLVATLEEGWVAHRQADQADPPAGPGAILRR